MKIEEFNGKGLSLCRLYDNNIFSGSPDQNVIEFKTKRGLKGLHYHSGTGEKNLILLPAMGRHVHDQRLCKFFSSTGRYAGVTTFDYAGTYESWDAGEFLPSAEGKLSIQEDLDEIIDTLHPQEPVEILGPCFGGAIAVQAAAERPEQVEAIYLFAPMLYGSPNKRYKDPQDKSIELGHFKTYTRYRGTEKEGWHDSVWMQMIKGNTQLNAHTAIPSLALSEVRIYGVACEHDSLISSKTLEDFANAYSSHASNSNSFFYIYEDEPQGNPGHFGHYKLEYAPGAIKSFCKFIGQDPKEVIAKKKEIDTEFAKKAPGKIHIEDPAEEKSILQGIAYLAHKFYLDDEDNLRQIVKAEPSKIKQFALGFIKGIII